MPGFWEDLASGLPIIGNIAGSAIERGQSRRAIERQNEYNLPKNQVQRITEAGLPYAAMTNAISGNQSHVQETRSSGIHEGIQDYASTRMQTKQLELIEAQIQATKTQAAKTAVEGNREAYDLQLRQMDPTQGEPVSQGARMAKLDYEMRTIQRNMMTNSDIINRIDREIKEDLHRTGTLSQITRSQLEGIINGVKLGKQAINKGLMIDTIIERMKTGGLTAFEALVTAFAMNQMGGSSIHFPNINDMRSTRHDYGERNTTIINRN